MFAWLALALAFVGFAVALAGVIPWRVGEGVARLRWRLVAPGAAAVVAAVVLAVTTGAGFSGAGTDPGAGAPRPSAAGVTPAPGPPDHAGPAAVPVPTATGEARATAAPPTRAVPRSTAPTRVSAQPAVTTIENPWPFGRMTSNASTASAAPDTGGPGWFGWGAEPSDTATTSGGSLFG